MTAALLLAAVIAAPACPIDGKPAAADSKLVDANGIRFRFCSEDCRAAFKLAPMEKLASAAKQGWTVGTAVFDPVAGRKLTPQTARGGTSDFGGVRFTFLNGANRSTFDADPKRFGEVPAQWAAICPVMDVELAHTYGASGYVDVRGVRIFACCEQCFPRLRAEPERWRAACEGKIGSPKAFDVPAVWNKLSGPG